MSMAAGEQGASGVEAEQAPSPSPPSANESSSTQPQAAINPPLHRPVAATAEIVTQPDAAAVTSNGDRLPAIATGEGLELNTLGTANGIRKEGRRTHRRRVAQNLDDASHANTLFPPLPQYGPPSIARAAHSLCFRLCSFILSLTFLMGIVVASLVISIPPFTNKMLHRATFRNFRKKRPFYAEECRRADIRLEKQKAWEHRTAASTVGGDQEGVADEFPPTEGGKDPIVCDVGYYARRSGLDVDFFKVRTEDDFIIDLWHVYDPKEYEATAANSTDDDGARPRRRLKNSGRKPKFPVLLLHGLLQSSGAFCCNDDDSLAFWLCKSGFDVWLGNNRCGFKPQHESLGPSDPRMWCWNIRQMGIYDLPALATRVLEETGFAKLGLICHSQGTAQTFVALAKDQRPELGEKLTVFCALAPAAYAGPLIGKIYFKFMRNVSPMVFRLIFGIHAFIPFMMQMHSLLEPRMYGWLGYKVFSFLFDWSDIRWDPGLRNRQFQFAPVYVSAETMRWWLGREGFAKHKCILTTKYLARHEARVDSMPRENSNLTNNGNNGNGGVLDSAHLSESQPWFAEGVPPFALWVCGNDDLVDGGRLLRRFEKGREPHARIVHSKVIEGYEHLDVIWAMDAVEQVFKEIREVLWQTCNVKEKCRVPESCGVFASLSREEDKEAPADNGSAGRTSQALDS